MKGEKRNPYRLLVGKPEVIKPLGSPRCSLVANISIDLEILMRCDGAVWTGLVCLSMGTSEEFL
jgi:hypothetical protein